MDRWEEIVALNNMVPYDGEDLTVEATMRQAAREQKAPYVTQQIEMMKWLRNREEQDRPTMSRPGTTIAIKAAALSMKGKGKH